jgi:hypothetical protein
MNASRYFPLMIAYTTLDPLSLPCCPFCDNAIEDSQLACVTSQDGTLFLAHMDCATEQPDEDDDDAALDSENAPTA